MDFHTSHACLLCCVLCFIVVFCFSSKSMVLSDLYGKLGVDLIRVGEP